MISDSITNASATSAPSARDVGKKKRNNKSSAKIKQSKLGLRREQWLSQVAVSNKGGKEERSVNWSEKCDQRDKPVENLDGVRREEENIRHESSFMESPSNSSVGGTDSSVNFSGRSSRSSSSSSGFCSGNITEEEEENGGKDDDDDGCVDDWEAVADALAAEEENEREKENLLREAVKEEESVGQSSGSNVGDSVSDVGVEDVKQDCLRVASRKQESNRAWRPDDDFRPQGLPNLAKQLSFPELDRRFSSMAIPSSCPICYEDLDLTDSTFLPCPCGFRLCLFCHKTICDGDGRCPGCRKPYERDALKAETTIQGAGLTIRLARSSSMFCRF